MTPVVIEVPKTAIELAKRFQLPFRVLVERANPDVPNALPSHEIPCKMRFRLTTS